MWNGVFVAVCLLTLFWMIDLLTLQKVTGNLKEISAIFALWTVHAITLYFLGMRQRLGIAQAIMENPDILILDEPMNGLDNQGVEDEFF